MKYVLFNSAGFATLVSDDKYKQIAYITNIAADEKHPIRFDWAEGINTSDYNKNDILAQYWENHKRILEDPS